jgi:NAD(P)-dependent dehydrogenase (short-subunit alcohol dehydrogenase family)
MREFSGRTAVVTGGGSGIGRGMALGLAAEGMTVAVLDLNEEGAEAVAAEVVSAGGKGLAERVRSQAGPAHVLCANAGVMAPLGPLPERSQADWEFVFSVNVFGVVQSVQAFLPQLRENAPEAHIVNTASLGGIVSVPGFPIGVYVASKYACVGYSESLRGELAGEGIGVSVLCPGTVESRLAETSVTQRPERYGGAGPTFDPGEVPADIASHFMPAEAVGPVVVRGIRANRLHILTHPNGRALVEARFQTLLDDFSFAEAEGD